jgi:NRPS condensation-like uncharacterized protein
LGDFKIIQKCATAQRTARPGKTAGQIGLTAMPPAWPNVPPRATVDKYTLGDGRLYLRHPNANICFRANISGSFTAADFEEAVRKIVERHPLLRSTMERDAAGILINPNRGKVGLEFYQTAELADWRDWYKKTDALPFDFENGPLVKICIIFDRGFAQLIVLGHHILADGIGYLNVAKDLLLALDNNLDAKEQMPPEGNSFITKTKLRSFEKVLSILINTGWKFNATGFTEKSYTDFFHTFYAKVRPSMQENSIEGNDLNRLLQICKQRALTVNEAILCAFASAMRDKAGRFGSKAMRFGWAVNIRKDMKIPVPDCMWNYLSAIMSKIKIDKKKTFDAVVKEITLKTRKLMQNLQKRYLPTLFLREISRDLVETIFFASYGSYHSPLAKTVGKLIGEIANNKGGVWVSNLGRHEFSHYTKFSLMDFQFIPPVFLSMLLTVGTITVNDRLSICLRYNETELSGESVRAVYTRAMELLFASGQDSRQSAGGRRESRPEV